MLLLTVMAHQLRILNNVFTFSLRSHRLNNHSTTPHYTLLPSETLAGTALRSIQKDTQDNMTIRVAGK